MKANKEAMIFHSPHSIEECYSILSEVVESSWFPYLSSKQLAGRVSKKSFSIRKRLNYRNSFQPVLRGSLETTDSGTEIVTRVGLHPAVKVFMWFWFGGLLLIGGIIFILALSSFFNDSASKGVFPIMGILIPPGMAIFGVALVMAGKFFAQDESEFLRQTVTNLLDAKEVR